MARAKSKGTSGFDGGMMKMKLASASKWEDKPYKGFFQPTLLKSGKGEGLIGFQTTREFVPGETWDSENADLNTVVKAMLFLAEQNETQVYDLAIRGLENFGPGCEFALKCKFFKRGSKWTPLPYIEITKATAKATAKVPAKATAKASTALKIPT